MYIFSRSVIAVGFSLLILSVPVFTLQAQVLYDPLPDGFFVRKDGSGPIRTNMQAVFTGPNTLRVSYQTDVPTVSVVEYATRAQYQIPDSYPFPSYKEDANLTTNHMVTLSDLIPDNNYYYRIRSIDKNKMESRSPVYNISPSVIYPPSTMITVISPVQGSTLGTPTVFSWNSVALVSEYAVNIGSAIGGKDIYSINTGLNTDATIISNIPTDGRALYLRIQYKVSGVWKYNDFTYKAFSDPTNPPITISARVGGRVISESENSPCTSTLMTPLGPSIGSCVRTLTTFEDTSKELTQGSYSLLWTGGFPLFADPTKPPIVTPSQILTANRSLIFYLDFQEDNLTPLLPASCTITTPTVTGSGPYNVKVPVSITNGPPMTTYYLYRSSSSAPNYVKTGYITTGSSGSTNISISDSSALSAGIYSYTILGNKVDAPKCSPAQTVTVGAGVVTPPVVTPPIVPQPPISPCLSPNVWNGTACVSPVTLPTLTINTSNIGSTYKIGDILPIKWTSKGVEKVNINLLDYKGSTIIRTIATVSASSGQYDWKVSDIDFNYDSVYTISISDASNPALKSKSGKIDFIPAPIPVTVLPWTAVTSVQVGQPLTYTLNWSGGPLDKSWRVFVHLVKDDNSHTFTAGDFWPNPTTDKWTGNIKTTGSVTIPTGTPISTYKVMVGLYDGAPRVTTLIAGTNVSSENPTQYRYQVGTITVLAPIQTQGASIWDAIGGFFGKLFGF